MPTVVCKSGVNKLLKAIERVDDGILALRADMLLGTTNIINGYDVLNVILQSVPRKPLFFENLLNCMNVGKYRAGIAGNCVFRVSGIDQVLFESKFD